MTDWKASPTRPSRRARRFAAAAAPTRAREALERRWYHRLVFEPSLATLVTARQTRLEPFHRWFPLRQGFAPELVRLFLHETAPTRVKNTLPLLDPFSGSGTTVVECARQRTAALGIEASPALVFLTQASFAREFPELPDLPATQAMERLAASLFTPVHRAALMLAVARGHTSRGTMKNSVPPIRERLAEVTAMMQADLSEPLPLVNQVQRGDARRLGLESACVGAILTSPPYLSRHDYGRILAPLERAYRLWYEASMDPEHPHRLRATKGKALVAPSTHRSMPEAVEEAGEALIRTGHEQLAGAVMAYFDDLFAVIQECRRVLADGGQCWMVLGGSRLSNTYVPTDLIVAEYALAYRFHVNRMLVARRLITPGRKLGTLQGISPRESILVMTASE